MSRHRVRLLILSWALGALAAGLVVALALAIAGKHALEARARAEARDFIAATGVAVDDKPALAVALTRRVHEIYRATPDSADPPLLMTLRPYLTHPMLPEPLRVEPGAIEALYLNGLCDSASRVLAFVLRQAGLDAWQMNLVMPLAVHTVVLAQDRAGDTFMLDPLHGVVPVRGGRLLGPDQAQAAARQGVPQEQLWQTLGPTADPAIYRQFAVAAFAKQNEPMTITVQVRLPQAGETPGVVVLGEEDGASEDVASAAVRRGWTPYWHYLGSRYDREWTRVFRFAQDTRVTFVLTTPPDRRFLTSERRPHIRGREVIYDIPAGDSLRLRDGLAGRSWLHFRSYQDVDYVRLEALSSLQPVAGPSH